MVHNEVDYEFYDKIVELSPKKIAELIFNEQPKDECSINILPFSDKYDADSVSFNFEILLTIFLESFMYILNVIKLQMSNEDKNGKTENEIYQNLYKNITINDLLFSEKWFNSFGYSIKIHEYDLGHKNVITNYLTNIKPHSYCRILLCFNNNDMLYFITNGIAEKYHFILTSNYKKTHNIDEIYTLLINKTKIYKISFQKYKPISKIVLHDVNLK